MNTNNPSTQSEDIEFTLAKMNEHANSKRFRDRNNPSFAKKNVDRKDRKRSRDTINDDYDEYYDEWN